MIDLSTLLRNHRQKAGLTQKQLAERINFSHSVISRVERSHSGYLPSDDFIAIFCQELGLDEAEKSALNQALQSARRKPEQEAVPRPVRFAFPWKWLAVGSLTLALGLVALYGFFFPPQPVSASYAHYTEIPVDGVLYADDFENRSLSDWKNLNNGRWEIFDVAGNRALGVRNQDPKAVPNAYLLISDDWVDYAMSVDVVFTSGVYEQIYLVVRSARQPNCSGYRIGGNRLGVSIFRFENTPDSCDGEVLAENIHYPLLSDKPYTMRVEVVGSEIKYYINNELVLGANDTKYPQGGLGFLAYQVKEAYFDNLQIIKIDE